MKNYLATVGTAALLVLSNVSWAQDKDPTDVPDHSLSEWKLGDLISGTDVKLEDLKGKVVAIEQWGVN
ncbi:MAG: hypothetical protein ACI8T1_005243 [Verrucomicrobiales bacterium]|jgi:hypothetical protein